jgi:HEAT repeat protein
MTRNLGHFLLASVIFSGVEPALALQATRTFVTDQRHSSARRLPPLEWQVQGLRASLNDPLESVQLLALEKIGQFPTVEAFPSSEVSGFLGNANSRFRASAARALGAIGARDRAGELAKLLRDPSSEVRGAAAEGLGAMHATDRAGDVVELLRDESPDIRSTAAEALGVMQARDQAGEVVKLLRDASHDVRSVAATALGAMQAKDEAEEVVKLLRSPSANVRIAATDALAAMRAKNEAREVAKLLRDGSSNVRSAAADALGAMQAREHSSEVVKLLRDPEPDVKASVARALGVMQAKDEARKVAKLLGDESASVRSAAANALGAMQAREASSEVVKLLRDQEPDVRASAADALGLMRATDRVGDVAVLLGQPADEIEAFGRSSGGSWFIMSGHGARLFVPVDEPRAAAVRMVEENGPLPIECLHFICESFYASHIFQGQARFDCHYLGGGDPVIEQVLKRIMLLPEQAPTHPATVGEARSILDSFHSFFPVSRKNTYLAQDTDEQIYEVAKEWEHSWTSADRDSLLQPLLTDLESAHSSRTSDFRELVRVPWWKTVLARLWKVLAVQFLFWTVLVFLYPKYQRVQAVFFWNRWVRKILGLAYVDILLTVVPVLQNRLLSPFRLDLIADAAVDDRELEHYFPNVEAKENPTGMVKRLAEAVPEIRGQIILEGESGLGKTIFLRRLVGQSPHTIAYLPADACASDAGPLGAIRQRLKGKAGDEGFLKGMIYSGGLGIVIDGINEVDVDARHRILAFLSEFPRSHILLATQPLQWKPPARARVVVLQPLAENKMAEFLKTRYDPLGIKDQIDRELYEKDCEEYLASVLGKAQTEEDRLAAQRILSNPMDLTTAAQLIGAGARPSVRELQEQQFRQMEIRYRQIHAGNDFPLRRFAESVYQARLKDEPALDAAAFFEEIQVMVRFKMALERHGEDSAGAATRQWIFRHDKTRDFFLMHAFLADQEDRVLRHLDDPRFRGAYIMLASAQPIEQARALRDAIVDHAADSKDHHLSDAVVQVLRTRRASRPEPV